MHVAKIIDELTDRADSDAAFTPRLHRELLERYSCLSAPEPQAQLAATLAFNVAVFGHSGGVVNMPQTILSKLLIDLRR